MGTRRIALFVLLSLCGVHVSYANKPSELSQAVFCEGCAATVNEILKKVNKKTGESREVKVVDAMEDICNLQNFGSYEYSPPKTGKACKYLIENFDEDIESIFVSETDDFEQKICYSLTQACEGVDRSKKEKEDLEVNINDRKQKLQRRSAKKDSGPEDFHVDINEEGAAEKLVSEINRSIKENKKQDIEENENDDLDDDDDDDDMDDDDASRDNEDDLKDKSDSKDDAENPTVKENDKTEL